MKILAAVLTLTFAAPALFSQTERTPISQIEDHSLSEMEHELVPLAEAMPQDKYNFAPTGGQFQNVRTFAQEITHIATVLYECGSGLLGEKMPVAQGEHENGAASLNNKEAIVKYLKDSLAYAHRGIAALNDANATEVVGKPFPHASRLHLAEIMVWHSYDHYGQAVIYLRMNGIVPPPSR